MKFVFIVLLLIISISIGQDHILLSEICVRNSPAEFIEIYNPTGAGVLIEDYYLTDLYGRSVSTDEFYPIIVNSPVQNQQIFDFLVQFPAGTVIEPGEALIIALNGTDFLATYSFEPDFEIIETGIGIPMRIPLNGFVGSSAELANGGGTVTVLYWDSYSDLVQDIDYASWSDDYVRRLDKTDICVDGPDTDDIESTYYNDTDPLIQDRISGGPHPNGQSFTRIDFTEGTETLSGGNGLYGHDETSENMSQTWAF
ncbi:MAG: lamin tail domain-containing protein, partial [Candidatus Aegiribacteria sp.]|nr:lamin tail domain-containing protein [Candidatus Aegiribacteria sp.]